MSQSGDDGLLSDACDASSTSSDGTDSNESDRKDRSSVFSAAMHTSQTSSLSAGCKRACKAGRLNSVGIICSGAGFCGSAAAVGAAGLHLLTAFWRPFVFDRDAACFDDGGGIAVTASRAITAGGIASGLWRGSTASGAADKGAGAPIAPAILGAVAVATPLLPPARMLEVFFREIGMVIGADDAMAQSI